MKTIILSALSLGCIFCSCRTQQTQPADIHSLNGEWQVVELNGTTQNPEKSKQTLVLNTQDFSVAGSTGCNRLMGSFKYEKGENIQFSQMATTRRACLDMKGEADYLKALSQIRRFETVRSKAGKETVMLYGEDKKPLIILEKE